MTGLWVVAGGLLGVLLGTFGEYWTHRAMHRRLLLATRHAEHHRQGEGQGVLREFFDYSIASLIGLGLLVRVDHVHLTGGWLFGGLLAGVIAHAAFAAWAHQAQHEDARLVPWMPMPVHLVHHRLGQTDRNFGISVDWWDRVFGTYAPEPAWRRFVDGAAARRRFWQVDWLDHRSDA